MLFDATPVVFVFADKKYKIQALCVFWFALYAGVLFANPDAGLISTNGDYSFNDSEYTKVSLPATIDEGIKNGGKMLSRRREER